MATDPLEASWKRVRSSWITLAQAAVWVFGVAGAFILPPPVTAGAQSEKIWVRFSQFVVAAIIGFLLIACRQFNRRRHARGWTLLSAGALSALAAAFLGYDHLVARWTVPYDGDRMVAGSALTSVAERYLQIEPDLTAADLLWDAAGDAEAVWTASSIERRRLILFGFYILLMPLATVCMISLIQAFSCFNASETEDQQAETAPPPRREASAPEGG